MKRFGVLFIFLLTLAGFTFAPAAHAIDPNTNIQQFWQDATKCVKGDCSNQQFYSTLQFNAEPAIFVGEAIGGDTTPGSPFSSDRSALAYMGNIMTSIYQTPPANLALWLQDTGQTLGFVPKQAYAQGIGFSGLSVLLDIWQAFRNIAYAILAVVMIVIGFMVMFRQKIDPKTVVTVQNALPRIVIALLLITFSYAIVGFMIDLMYIVLFLVISTMVSASHGALGSDTANIYVNGGFLNLLKSVFGGFWQGIDDVVAFITPGSLLGAGAATVGAGVGISAYMAGALALGPAIVGAIAAPILVVFIIAIVLLFAVIRIFFLLIGAYIQILISLLTAPFQLLATAIPGNNAFGSWILNLVANLLVFPLTAGLLLVANILAVLEKNPTGGGSTGLWVPPVLGGTGHGVAGVIAIGILLSIPSIVNGIKESFKIKPIAGVGGLGGIAGMGGTALQYGFQYISQSRQTRAIIDAQQRKAAESGGGTSGGGGQGSRPGGHERRA